MNRLWALGSGSRRGKGGGRGGRSSHRGSGGGGGGGGGADSFARLRRHAELVLQLRGTDATEDMFNLVFKASSVAATPRRSSNLSSLASGASWRLRAAFTAAPGPSLARLFSA